MALFQKGQIPWNKSNKINNCRKCGKEISTNPSEDKIFCSKACLMTSYITKCEICKKEFRTYISTKQRFCSKPCLFIHRRTMRAEKSGMFKGDKAKYGARHMWVKANFETGNTCEFCGKNRNEVYQLEWANISGQYKREREDWHVLCTKCHRNWDKNPERRNLSLQFRAEHR